LMLLSVQAVGPKVALAVLSGGAPRELITAIAAGDAARFQAVPGIGKRTAERIIVELREKVVVHSDGEALDESILATRGGHSQDAGDDGSSGRGLARAGLIELGYAPVEADSLLMDAEGENAEELIAHALRLARSGA
jgi:holliday junction DNA helicase RuvA